MLLIHETGVVAKVHQTGPHTRRVLQHSRHRGLVCVFTMPRVKGVDPLVLAQSDLVYVFELPNPDDRRQLAGIIGWSPADLDAGVAELGRHEYLRFDANQTAPEDGGWSPCRRCPKTWSRTSLPGRTTSSYRRRDRLILRCAAGPTSTPRPAATAPIPP